MHTATIRPLRPEDSAKAGLIFFDAVMNGTTRHYSLAERQAWAGPAPDIDGWRHRLDEVEGFAAEIEGKLVGFMTLDADGHIDLAFMRPDCAGQGIGHSLYTRIEQQARDAGISRLTVDASKAARPFFERLGWQVKRQQTVEKRGVNLTNYRMTKALG